jgi:hypothetical protein
LLRGHDTPAATGKNADGPKRGGGTRGGWDECGGAMDCGVGVGLGRQFCGLIGT